MKRYIAHLWSHKAPLLIWSLVASVCLVGHGFIADNLPPSVPEFGFDSQQETQEFDKIFAEKSTGKSILILLGLTPLLLIASATAIGKFVDLFDSCPARYIVVSALVANTATIALTADGSMTDQLHHVNYLASQRNIDYCREALMHRVGWSIEKLRDEHQLAFMVKEVNVKYRHQIRDGDPMRIRGTIEQVSPMRIQVSFAVTLPNLGDKLAIESSLIMPLVSLKTGRPIVIPDWLSEAWREQDVT